MKLANILGSLLFSIPCFAQFAPQVGIAGTTAIHKDSSIIINWAKACVLNRGWQNIADITLGRAQVGDETFVPGPAGNGIVSLGDGGQAIVTFEKPIKNGIGADFAIFENGFIDQTLNPGTAFLELAFVEVSSDGIHYFRFPAQSMVNSNSQIQSFEGINASQIDNLAGKYLANYGTPFDLAALDTIVGLDIDKITHVKIIDVVGSIDTQYARRDNNQNIVNDPWPTPFASSGFDLDAVGVIHQNDAVGLSETTSINKVIIFPTPALVGETITVKTKPGSNLQLADANGIVVMKTTANDLLFTFSVIKAGIYFFCVDNHYYKLTIQ